MNRQSRRFALGSVTAATVALSAAALVGCAATVASIGASAANGAMAAIIARVQAGEAAFGIFATALGTNLSAAAQTAIAKVLAAGQTIGNAIANGATAVANAAANTGISGLLQAAADAVIPLLRLVPGLGTLVSVAQDVKALIPTIVASIGAINNPTATGAAPYDGGAARRLGIIA
jgi:hypothetical protein